MLDLLVILTARLSTGVYMLYEFSAVTEGMGVVEVFWTSQISDSEKKVRFLPAKI